jgi:hypothetical protein
MVALREEGRPVASWIWQPTSQTMYTAEAGCGATRNGLGVTVTPRPSEAGGVARRPDTSPYRPADTCPGLLAAEHSIWDAARAALLPEVLPDHENGHGM